MQARWCGPMHGVLGLTGRLTGPGIDWSVFTEAKTALLCLGYISQIRKPRMPAGWLCLLFDVQFATWQGLLKTWLLEGTPMARPDVNMEDLPEDGDGILLRFLEAWCLMQSTCTIGGDANDMQEHGRLQNWRVRALRMISGMAGFELLTATVSPD
jgi:hypothetical protein